MSDSLTAFVTAIGLVFVIEGVLYALLPAFMRRTMARALIQPIGRLRAAGLAAALFGLLVVWLVH
jgi:uncharacterized protein YjeT (DUF2065 family)